MCVCVCVYILYMYGHLPKSKRVIRTYSACICNRCTHVSAPTFVSLCSHLQNVHIHTHSNTRMHAQVPLQSIRWRHIHLFRGNDVRGRWNPRSFLQDTFALFYSPIAQFPVFDTSVDRDHSVSKTQTAQVSRMCYACFLYSLPQLIGIIPCPRHRLPK